LDIHKFLNQKQPFHVLGMGMSNESTPKKTILPPRRGFLFTEEQLYKPIKNALQIQFERFVGSEGKVHLYITANGHFPEELKEALDDKALGILRIEKMIPDIVGFLQKDQYNKDLVTVEIKPDRITINDIWKARLYAEVLNAKYGIIISPKKLQEEIKRFLRDRISITYRNYNSFVIVQFDTERNDFKFDEKLYPKTPEPFSDAFNMAKFVNFNSG